MTREVGSGPRRRAVLLGAGALPLLLAGCLRETDAAVGAAHPSLRPPRAFGELAVLDVAADPAAARAALGVLADRARRANATAANRVMLGVGGTWFDKAQRDPLRPTGVSSMPPFPGDLLDPARTGRDLLVQVEGDTAADARERLAAVIGAVSGLTSRWSAPLQRPGNRVREGRPLMTNGFGFTEGFGNVDGRDGADVNAITQLRPGAGVPDWAEGGTLLAARVVRLSSALWDAEPIDVQERVIGRRRDGRWLDGTEVAGEPDFGADPQGRVTPLDSHVRRAHPRAGEAAPPLIRRSWNYTTDGDADHGILFMSYQADIGGGFAAVQNRLAGQALDPYILTVGGGYYVVPPPDGDGRWEDALR